MLLEVEAYEEAREQFERAIKFNPKSWKARWQIGNLFLKLNVPIEAIKYYDEAIQSNPRSDVVYNSRGEVLLTLNFFKGAIICFDKAIELNPGNICYIDNKNYALTALANKEANLRLQGLANEGTGTVQFRAPDKFSEEEEEIWDEDREEGN